MFYNSYPKSQILRIWVPGHAWHSGCTRGSLTSGTSMKVNLEKLKDLIYIGDLLSPFSNISKGLSSILHGGMIHFKKSYWITWHIHNYHNKLQQQSPLPILVFHVLLDVFPLHLIHKSLGYFLYFGGGCLGSSCSFSFHTTTISFFFSLYVCLGVVVGLAKSTNSP